MDFFDVITEEEKDEKETQVISEGLVDVVFKSFKTHLKTSVHGSVVQFSWEFLPTKSKLKFEVRKNTLLDIYKWLGNIVEDVAAEE